MGRHRRRWILARGKVSICLALTPNCGLICHAAKDASNKDWVKSDTDEQLMLFIPFQSTLKVHSLHLTSLPASADEDDVTLRPKTLKVYKNRAQILGFDEADESIATQDIELSSRDWDPKTGTAKVELRFVNFQNVTSLVIFVVDGDGN